MPTPSDQTDTLDQANAALLANDERLVAALRAGDERAFTALIGAYHPTMLRLARSYVSDHAVAQEVVQEAWLGVLQGLDRFEGRAALKTWIFHILVNRARTRAVREDRTIPFSALAHDEDGETGTATVEPERFDRVGGAWVRPPDHWDSLPEERLLARETRACLQAAIEAMPASQRAVITLRDVQGLTAAEVCQILDVSEANQRVLLHRARARARRALERYLAVDKERS